MAKIKRNGPCPCGSGSKAKRCCYGTARAGPRRDAAQRGGDAAIEDLSGTDEIELRVYFDGLVDLPELDTSLQVRLPGLITPDMERAIDALREDDYDGFDDALEKVLGAIDSPERRLALAEAVLRLRDQGQIQRSSPPWPFSSSTAQSRCSSAPRWPNHWPCSQANSALQRDCSSPLHSPDRAFELPDPLTYWRAL